MIELMRGLRFRTMAGAAVLSLLAGAGTARAQDPSPETTEGAPESEAAPVSGCADYPTWYDAQLTLESSVDPAVIGALDPDGDTIACEEVMYP